MKINARERAVLTCLAEHHSYEGFGFMTFKPIMAATRLRRSEVRRACRALKRKGLAEYSNGLCNDDGAFMGAGYASTQAGVDFLEGEG